MNKPIDIFILCYKRPQYTRQTLSYLYKRTGYPFRIFLLIQDNDLYTNYLIDHEFKDKIFMRINFSKNIGVHSAWNIALALTESEYFITSDNDIYVPKLEPDWLTKLVGFLDERPDYGAISLHPHVFIGAAGIDPDDSEDVKERNMCGAVMRIMRRDAVWKAGGWENIIHAGRNHEERTICLRLQNIGYKVGITSRIRAYHPFGKDVDKNSGWGYTDFTPEEQGHNPQLKDYVLQFDNPDAYDKDTFLPK